MSTLPLNQETADFLTQQLSSSYYDGRPWIGQSYSLTPKHFFLKNTRGSTPLTTAAMNGALYRIVEVFKDSQEGFPLKLFSRKDEHGVALLHHAVAHGELPQVSALIKPCGDHLSLEHVLLEQGNSGLTVLHQAAGGRRLPQISAILYPLGQHLTLEHILSKDRRNGQHPLRLAAADGHLDRLLWMLDPAGPRPTLDNFLEKDKDGVTCLHEAARGRCLDQLIEELLRSGQKLLPEHFLLKDKKGNTPLSIAVSIEVQGGVSHIFNPSLWTGRLAEMQKLWEQVPEKARQWVDYKKVVEETIVKSLPPPRRLDLAPFRNASRSIGADDSCLPSGAAAAIIDPPRTRSSIG